MKKQYKILHIPSGNFIWIRHDSGDVSKFLKTWFITVPHKQAEEVAGFFLAEEYMIGEGVTNSAERKVVISTNKNVLKKLVNDKTFRCNIGIDISGCNDYTLDVGIHEFEVVEVN